ncbi:hypothetical protein GPEL0_01r4053 [Geoanaerobacter pelophilus]|uniref:Uncharacterized protein n=1 Tax=Geoanaerobacter pelophilus TaxID=60036 RepID=A0ABQ0MLX1_9BACT|nr:hypothetical protein GPEL0_01r4053 [Geoanaerobacter pelophilus]
MYLQRHFPLPNLCGSRPFPVPGAAKEDGKISHRQFAVSKNGTGYF